MKNKLAQQIFSLTPKKVDFIETKFRKIKTFIPAPGTEEIFKRLSDVESRSMHGQLPIVWKKAKDFAIYDIAGNKWIDFTSTIFVTNIGHSNSKVSESIKETLDNPLYSCYAYANPIRAEYIENLIRFAGKPFEKAFLMSAGTEATEAAMKLMRMYGEKIKKRKLGLVCIENNWHGRTLGAQMMCSNISQKRWVGYSDPNIHFIPFPYPWEEKAKNPEQFFEDGINKLIKKGINPKTDICGFMLETFQGWGAVFYPDKFVQSIRRFCDANQILLTFDEMQSGFGRTGENFGYKHYGVQPDLICCGKGMGGGVPLSGVIGKGEIMDLPTVGNMSSTHSANPLVCSAGLAVINQLEERNLIKEAKRKGEILFKKLNELKESYPKRVSYILGKGLIAAILLKNPKDGEPDALFASKVAERCMQKGLLVVHTGRESIKLGPPLCITDEALIEGVDVISESIKELN